MHVFISYARRDQVSIAQLRADFERLGHPVWFDREHYGGQSWWDQVLRRVRDCGALVFALSPDSLRSAACMAELRYAIALRRPVLAVRVRPVDSAALPQELRGVDVVEYVDRTPESVITLLKAFNALPMARPHASRLPPPPEIPTTYLTAHLARVNAGQLAPAEQDELFEQLSDRLRDPQEFPAVWDLLVRLRAGAGLSPLVAAKAERLLEPGWRPDPRGRFDARHWDGQVWTTLVRQGDREFNDRNSPPPSSAHLPTALEDTGTHELPTTGRHADPEPRARRGLPWLVAAGVLVLACGVTGGVVWAGAGPDQEAATSVARNFVDAVNTRDEAAMQRFVCDRDVGENAHLYRGFLETANVTLEGVDVSGSDPRFTVLAARTAGNSSVKLSIALTEEDGGWKVCDISRALSGR